MADEGAPNITRYWGALRAGGYVFYHFENKEQSASYVEEISFEKFDSMQLLKPQKGKGFKVEVKPQTW